jgi:hypothetical protein
MPNFHAYIDNLWPNSGPVVHLNYFLKIFWSRDVIGKHYITDLVAGPLVCIVRSSCLGGVRIAEDAMYHLTVSKESVS